mgnify:CR=1 FL=1
MRFFFDYILLSFLSHKIEGLRVWCMQESFSESCEVTIFCDLFVFKNVYKYSVFWNIGFFKFFGLFIEHALYKGEIRPVSA